MTTTNTSPAYDYTKRYEILRNCGMDHADAVNRIVDEWPWDREELIRQQINTFLANIWWWSLLSRA